MLTRKTHERSRPSHNRLTLTKAWSLAEPHVPCKNELRLCFQLIRHVLCLAQWPRPGDPTLPSQGGTCGAERAELRVAALQLPVPPQMGLAQRAGHYEGATVIPTLLAELGETSPKVTCGVTSLARGLCSPGLQHSQNVSNLSKGQITLSCC